jgi:glycosyltransferase involved in cell wall biosynthesis
MWYEGNMDLSKVSVTILAKNSQKHLKDVLQALMHFGEVILYDTGSTDSTVEIARSFKNVNVVHAPFIGFGPTHNMASAVAKNSWILSIDSDEVASRELVKAIEAQELDQETVYSFPRRNYFNGKFIKWCGWYPDRQIRLYNRNKTRFTDDQVHEGIISEGMKYVAFNAPVTHYSYGTISDFLAKMQVYSTLFAEQNRGKRSSSPLKALLHGFFAFFKSYILKRGIFGGYEGLVISSYNGHTAYYKYLKLYEANLRLNRNRMGNHGA